MSAASTVAIDPVQSLRQGDPRAAAIALNAQVRARPEAPELRIFLFQLLAVLGDWSRAESQLRLAAELSADNAMIAGVYTAALRGERERAAVFAGAQLPPESRNSPLWLRDLHSALSSLLAGDDERAGELRGQAFEQAPPSAGEIDGEAFQWIADADSRFGPSLEVILEDGYAWVPFNELAELRFEAPTDLCDKVWAQVRLYWRDGRKALGFVPVRYPGSEREQDGALVLARRTEWDDLGDMGCLGKGQRMLVTDTGEYSLLDLRFIRFVNT